MSSEIFSIKYFTSIGLVWLTRRVVKQYLASVMRFIYFTAILAILMNGGVKLAFCASTQEMAKLGANTFHVRDSPFNFSVIESVNDRVKPFEFGEQFTSEGCSCLVKSGLLVDSISDIPNKGSGKNSANNFFKVIYEKFKHRPETPFDWFWWFVILPICLMPLWVTWLFPNIYSFYS